VSPPPDGGEDAAFADIPFLPWMGLGFWQGAPACGGLRTLVVGDSQYEWKGRVVPDRLSTRKIISDEIERPASHKFHPAVATAVLGGRPAGADLAAFWQSVAMHNLVQEFMPDSDTRPSRGQWREGVRLLPFVLDALRPQFVLACGAGVYDALLGREQWSYAHQADSTVLRLRRERSCLLPLAPPAGSSVSQAAVMGMIFHPAARQERFDPAVWHPRVRRYVARAAAVADLCAS
jgi:hypothetical protein